MQSKAELKRQKAAAKLKPQLIKNPAMIGAGLLAGGIGVGVGRLQGKSIDAEIANAYK